MKRPCEDSTSDSDMDETIDVGSENNYSGQSSGSFIKCGSPTTTSQVMARKKRRGIKLEINVNGYFDAHSLAMDFMSIGFRECLTEVARYLSSVEGLDSGDPLRVRLVSHLSSCASQREAAAMTTSMAHHQQALHPHHWASALHPIPAAFLQQSGLPSSESSSSRLSEVPQRGAALLTSSFTHSDSALRVPSTGSIAPCVPPLSTSLLSISATVHAAAAAAAAQTFPLTFSGGFPLFSPSVMASSVASSSVSPSVSTSTTSQQSSGSNSKPYRPWGTEVGAF
ncbi:hypothetical protein cypCar_00005378 [Cyprinus carpio]|nr:hypothetical protein cypCar_00005378 [Cyprinus carpio]